MIKPFTILGTRVEADGTLGVLYSVQKREVVSPTVMRTKTLESYLSMPAGEDVDAFVYQHLKEAGWVE
jgi:hypothetical protein